MKIITLVTTITRDKHGKEIWTPPGEVDVDEETAQALLARGQAKTVAEAKAEEAAKDGGVRVRTTGNGPSVKPG
jgi:hypothetical protein